MFLFKIQILNWSGKTLVSNLLDILQHASTYKIMKLGREKNTEEQLNENIEIEIISKLSQNSKLKHQFLTEMVIISLQV